MIDILLQVFSTSPSPDSCTMGVWAAYDPRLQLIILDTEGSISSLKDIVQPLLTSIIDFIIVCNWFMNESIMI